MAYELTKHLELSVRQKTTAFQKVSKHFLEKIVPYVTQVRQVSQKFPYKLANISVMDETAVWADMAAETTIKKNGGKRLPLKVLFTRKCV